jgi:hypothetical protein
MRSSLFDCQNSSDDKLLNDSPDLSVSSNSVESINPVSNEISNEILPNNGLSETESQNKAKSGQTLKKVYSFSANSSPSLCRKNLVSENGSIIWDADCDWIQLYDRMLRLNGRSASFRQYRSCGCKGAIAGGGGGGGGDRDEREGN